MDRALEKAIDVFDGMPSRLAAAIDESPATLSNWRKRGRVPAEKCRKIEVATGGRVPRSMLRPDVFGPSESMEGAA